MKVVIVVLSILALSTSAPQPRKIFHEHAEDFWNLIMEEVGDNLIDLVKHYIQFEEIMTTAEYMSTVNFKNLVYEMESLPEFKAVIDFLEKDHIDIIYFIDLLNDIIDDMQAPNNEKTQTDLKGRQTFSGKDMTALIKDYVNMFPKEKLTALYEKKIVENEEFRLAMENLQSDEWNQIWNALWESEDFLEGAKTLYDHGIDLQVLLYELKAVFGQF